MGLRPAKCYRKLEKPYTRISQRKPKKSYVVGVPGSKIVRFVHGNQEKEFDTLVQLVAENNVQIRHNALEAARISMNRYLEKSVTRENFYMRIRIFPHHVLREHSLATGAGADRFSSGMRKAFGRPVGKAAQVREGQVMIDILIDSKNIKHAREALRRCNIKFPTPTRTVVKELEEPSTPHTLNGQ